ncbi:conjugal transfer protein TraH, partial [Cysteiniphilum litorale]|uniref:conjugal transfer protein TraH n=1 Tax=Cysteiniphilum litorale TaxID=2056700 RepID=UPI003F885A8D
MSKINKISKTDEISKANTVSKVNKAKTVSKINKLGFTFAYRSVWGLSFFVSLIAINISHANLSNDMQAFLADTGYASNISSSKAVIDQQGGYVTAGSGYIRTPVKNLQLIDVQAPNV